MLLGDRVEAALKTLGADKVAKLYEKIGKKPCGCASRRQALNEMGTKQIGDNCVICGRLLDPETSQNHHLKPVTFKSRTKEVHQQDNLVTIHKMCHQKIHSVFSEKELFDYYHTVDRITEHEEMQKFIKWINKKPLDYYSKSDDTHFRKSKRQR